MNKIRLLLVSVLTLGLIAPAVALVPTVVRAQNNLDINNSLCAGANNSTDPSGTNCNTSQDGTKNKVQSIVNQVISIFSWVVGIVSVVMIIFGGFKYITSGGDSNGVTSAKNTILFAIVGLVIVALAQIIVKFVIGTVSDATTTDTGNNPQ